MRVSPVVRSAVSPAWILGFCIGASLLLLTPAILFFLPVTHPLSYPQRVYTLTGVWYGYADPQTATTRPFGPTDLPADHGQFRIRMQLRKEGRGTTQRLLGTLVRCDLRTGQTQRYHLATTAPIDGPVLKLQATSTQATSQTHRAASVPATAVWLLDRLAFELHLPHETMAGILSPATPTAATGPCRLDGAAS